VFSPVIASTISMRRCARALSRNLRQYALDALRGASLVQLRQTTGYVSEASLACLACMKN
jgi:hypothetical protein